MGGARLVAKLFASKAAGRTDGNFVDLVRVRVRGGAGGNGASGFDRCVRVSRGRPSGGNGGPGGNVVFVPDPALDSLNHLAKMYRAGAGVSGGRNMRGGARGEDCIVRIPLGGVVREVLDDVDGVDNVDGVDDVDDVDGVDSVDSVDSVDDKDDVNGGDGASKEDDQKGEGALERREGRHRRRSGSGDAGAVMASFELNSAADAPVIVARGGRGGVGNYVYGRNNHECEKGQPGHDRILEVELKTIADVGLVGVPNAGKSSFLAAVSNAHPRIAPYPFTTLNPYVGVIEFADGRQVTVADIPGLIEGAHRNRGLGHQFLRHIVKARILALVVDFAHAEPWRDVATLLGELELYQAGLSAKCKLVIANKADLLDAATLRTRVRSCGEALQAAGAHRMDILPISALHRLAVTKITHRMRAIIDAPPE